MSLRAIVWAFDQELDSSTKKFTLIALANFANDNGIAYPAKESLSELTMLHRDTVRKNLDELVESGLIIDTGRKAGGTQQVTVYQLPEKARERCRKTGSLPEKGAEKPAASQNPKNKGVLSGSAEKGAEKPAAIREPSSSKEEVKAPKRLLTDLWCSEYPKHHGGDGYVFQGPRDGQAADRLLKAGFTPEAAIELARRAWKRPDLFNCRQAATLSGFTCRINEIRAELKGDGNGKGNGANHPVGPRRSDGTANAGLAHQYEGVAARILAERNARETTGRAAVLQPVANAGGCPA